MTVDEFIGECRLLTVRNLTQDVVRLPHSVAHLCEVFYGFPGNGAGGALHIVLDDGNTGAGDVEFCRDYARERGDEAGVALAELLLSLTQDERDALYEYDAEALP